MLGAGNVACLPLYQVRLPHLTQPTRIQTLAHSLGTAFHLLFLTSLAPTAIILALFRPVHIAKKPTGCSIIPTTHAIWGKVIT